MLQRRREFRDSGVGADPGCRIGGRADRLGLRRGDAGPRDRGRDQRRTGPRASQRSRHSQCHRLLRHSGAALGLGLGLAGGLIRRSVLWTVLAATIGLVLGGLAGAGVAWLTLPVYYKHLKSDDLAYSLLVHGGTWTAIGDDCRPGVRIRPGRLGPMRRCLLGAAAGALLATVIYELAG